MKRAELRHGAERRSETWRGGPGTRAFLCLLLAVSLRAGSKESLQSAAEHLQQGQLAEAEREAKVALADPAAAAVACSVLGAIRFEQKRYDDSARFLQKAIGLDPRLTGAQLNLAQIYTLQGKRAAALALYKRAFGHDPSNASARLALARAEAASGNYGRSLELARPLVAALKRSPDGLVLLATDYLKTGDRASAGALVDDWKQIANIPPAASLEFGVLLARSGLPQQAIAVFEGAGGPPSYELAFNLAGARLIAGDPRRALEDYDAALGLNPASVPALRQAAEIAERDGELERSLSYWMRARKLQPEDPDILSGFGRVCLKLDLLEDAEPPLAKAVALRPGEAAFRYALASAKVGKRQFEAAQAILEELVRKRPRDAQLQYALGAVLYLEAHLDEAAIHLRESVRLQPDQLASYYYLGLIARDQGRQDDAIETLERVVLRHPEHAPSYEALGGLLMTERRYPEAENNLEKAVGLNPKSVKANYQLGLLLARMGKKQESEKRLEIAKSLRQEDEATSRLQLRLLEPER